MQSLYTFSNLSNFSFPCYNDDIRGHFIINVLCLYQRESLSASLAKHFFEHHLDSEEETKKHFLPALKTLATTERFRLMAMYMLLLLLHKMPENGVSLLTAALPSEVHNYTK